MSPNGWMSAPRAPQRTAPWKIACGIFAALVFVPVAGLALGFFVLTALPIVPLLVPMVVAFWPSGGHHAPPASPTRPSLVPSPGGKYRLAHGSA